MKKMLNDFAYSALFAAALGVVLLIWPSLSGKIICYGLAAVLLALGVYRIICYFVRDAMMTMLRGDLMAGLVLIALGIFVIAKPDVIVSVLPVLFGLLLILGAMSEIQTAFNMLAVFLFGFLLKFVSLQLLPWGSALNSRHRALRPSRPPV